VSQIGSARQVYVFSLPSPYQSPCRDFAKILCQHAQSSEDNTKGHLTRDYNLLTPYRAKLDGASLEKLGLYERMYTFSSQQGLDL
jgi:hypothetical protein